MNKHSETPYEIERIDSRGTLVYCRIKSKSGETVGYTSKKEIGVYEQHDKDLSEANARFIVKACNNHEKLVEALRTMVDVRNGGSLLTNQRKAEIDNLLSELEKDISVNSVQGGE